MGTIILVALVIGVPAAAWAWKKFHHDHYWGIPCPHPKQNNKLIQTCYECSQTRNVLANLKPDEEAIFKPTSSES